MARILFWLPITIIDYEKILLLLFFSQKFFLIVLNYCQLLLTWKNSYKIYLLNEKIYENIWNKEWNKRYCNKIFLLTHIKQLKLLGSGGVVSDFTDWNPTVARLTLNRDAPGLFRITAEKLLCLLGSGS